MFMKNLGVIPGPLEMMSASPAIFNQQLQRIHYNTDHPTLSFALLSHIRYLVAYDIRIQLLLQFQQTYSAKTGDGRGRYQANRSGSEKIIVGRKESAMLPFVVKTVKDPNSVKADEVLQFKEMGWEDKDLVDAVAHGVNMIDHEIMMTVFQMVG